MYHRIASLESDVYGLAVSPDAFREQMAVVRRDYRPVPLAELVEAARAGDAADDRVAITFDDGYVDNLTTASPILIEMGLPATFFVTTGGLDAPAEYWWDVTARVLLGGESIPGVLDLYGDGRWSRPTTTPPERRGALLALDELIRSASGSERGRLLDRVIAWGGLDVRPRETHRRLMSREIRELAARPCHAIGAHTVRHLSLPDQPADVQRREIGDSRETLEQLIGKPVRAFAYPFGAVNEDTRRLVHDAGFNHVVTVRSGTVHPDSDPLLLPRVEIRDDDGEAFATRLRAVRGAAA